MRSWKKFKKWMAYNPPYSLSASEWRSFNEEFTERAPIRRFFHDTMPKFFRPVAWAYSDVRNWIVYRTIFRYHVVKTGLKPGYHQVDERILYSSFSMLKHYVEHDIAYQEFVWDYDRAPTWIEKLPYYRHWGFNKPELGINHLRWEATLDDPSLPAQQQSPDQAKSSREILELYEWWVNKRPSRPEGINLDYDTQGCEMGPLDEDFDKTAPDYVLYKQEMGKFYDLQDTWDDEDDNMLQRLIKIRRSIWM